MKSAAPIPTRNRAVRTTPLQFKRPLRGQLNRPQFQLKKNQEALMVKKVKSKRLQKSKTTLSAKLHLPTQLQQSSTSLMQVKPAESQSSHLLRTQCHATSSQARLSLLVIKLIKSTVPNVASTLVEFSAVSPSRIFLVTKMSQDS